VNKKDYVKPVLNTKAIALGVFGNYGQPDPSGGGGDVEPKPIKIINSRQLHMD